MASSTQCSDQLIVRPKITRVEGEQVLSKRRAVHVVQGQAATIEINLLNQNGDAVNLTSCGFPSSESSSSSLPGSGSIVARMREILSFGQQSPTTEIAGTVVDAENGVVRIPLTQAVVVAAGIEIMEVGVLDADNNLQFSNQLYVLVERGLFGKTTDLGPPSLDEIKLRLRSSGPEDSFLLADEEFDLAEICQAIFECVRYWNESQPPISWIFNTANFKFREQWLMGIVGRLYQIAATHYRRERVSYAAAGITFDDKNKSQEYEEIGRLHWAQFAKWVLLKKAQFNAEATFGAVESSYSGWVPRS